MNIPDKLEVEEKVRRLRKYMTESGYEAVVIGRQDNFSWFTCGGNNRVVITSETGFTILIITMSQVYAVSQIMDGPRVFDEELAGLNIQPVFLKWYEHSREQKVMELVRGLRVISDIPLDGAGYNPKEIYKLHYPLTDKEVEKCRIIGAKTEEILRKVADEIQPGMTENEIEAMLLYEYGRINATPEVLLVGSDERIFRYRHPNPSDKKIEKYVLLHPGLKKWGLHANVTRLVYFGDSLPADIQKKYDAACHIEAAAISMCIPGEKFNRILEVEKRLYSETGYPDEWENHFQGGITGYLLADAALCMDPEAEVVVNQAYDWFITITGVKVEELGINTERGRELLSVTGKWPVKEYCFGGQKFCIPQILMR